MKRRLIKLLLHAVCDCCSDVDDKSCVGVDEIYSLIIFFFLLLFRFLVFYANAFWFLVCDSAVFNSDAVVFVLLLLFLYDRHTATETSVVCAWRTLRSVAPPAHFHFHLMLQIGTAYINNI